MADNTSTTVAEWREAQRVVKRRKPKSIKRRRRLERNAEQWLKYYLSGSYPLEFGKPHRQIIDSAKYVIKTGGAYTVAGSRGFGKSTLFWGLCLFYTFTDKVTFPAYLPWDAVARKRGLTFWKNQLCFNRRLAADYPEICDPFIVSRGSAQRCMSLVWNDGAPTGARIKLSDGMIVLPDSQGCMGSATINGNPRGLNLATEDGKVLRPDLLLLDDVQDKDTARSRALVQQTIDVIDTDVMGMAGPDTILPALMACTVLAPDDVSSHYLGDDTPDWEGAVIPQIESWPKGWEKEDSKVRQMWVEWNRLRLAGAEKRDGGKGARAYYKKHRDVLTRGMQVSWKERYDKKRRQPDAKYAAMHDYFRLGHAAFMAERQCDPPQVDVSLYELTVELIAGSFQKGRRPLQVPDWVRLIIVGTDINLYGLHSVMIGFGNDQTAAVLWYGRFDGGRTRLVPKNASEAQRKAQIYEALVAHGKQIEGAVPHQGKKKCPVNVWLIDGGYEHEVVQRYVKTVGSKTSMEVHVCRGYAADRYRPSGRNSIGKPREQCHMARWPMGKGLAFNADYWREVVQRAWLGSVGSPGSISLMDVMDGNHREFAEHFCKERLAEKIDGKTGVIWRWVQLPGRHDYQDAAYQCYVGAAWNGIGTQGNVEPRKKKKARAIIGRPSQKQRE